MAQSLLQKSTLRGTYCKDDQHDHERTLGEGGSLLLVILSQEEERAKANLLNIQPHKHVLDRLGEEEASGVVLGRHVELPQEKVLIHEIKQEKCGASKSVDDGRNKGVGEGCNNRLMDGVERRKATH